MSFNFIEEAFTLGNQLLTNPTFQFYKKGFVLGGSGQTPSWQDIILSGVGSLTLTKAKANGLNYVKLYGACEQRNLPEGYTQVEYIESTGTQYIDSGVNPTATKLQVNFKMQRTSDIYSNYFGAVAGTTPRNGFRVYIQQETVKLTFQSGSAAATYTMSSGLDAVDFKSTLTNGGNASITVNGDSVTLSDITTTLSTNILIGAAKVGTSVNGVGTFKIWSFEILKENEPVFIGIPCKNSSNVYGLYDLVTNTFKSSAVSTEFTGGAAITAPTPSLPIDIVCNNGTIKVSPNLFGRYTTETGYWQSDGTWSTDANYNSYQYITLKPNTTYTISNDVAPDYWRLTLFNGNTFSSRLLQQGGTSYTFTTNASENKISIAFNKNSISDVSKVQLELGSTPTPYMPYGQIYTQGTQEVVTDSVGNVATCERLLSIDSYKDTQEILSGAVTHNIGIKVLDGTEDWVVQTGGNSYFYFSLNVGANEGYNYSNISSHFPSAAVTLTTSSQGFMVQRRSATGLLGVYLRWDNLYSATQENLNSFKQWLSDQYNANTPVIIIYRLATPTTESVTGQTLTTKAGTNNVEITQASIGSLSLEVSYKGTI